MATIWEWSDDRLEWFEFEPDRAYSIESAYSSNLQDFSFPLSGANNPPTHKINFFKYDAWKLDPTGIARPMRRLPPPPMTPFSSVWEWWSEDLSVWKRFSASANASLESKWAESERAKSTNQAGGLAGFPLIERRQFFKILFASEGLQYNLRTGFIRGVRRRTGPYINWLSQLTVPTPFIPFVYFTNTNQGPVIQLGGSSRLDQNSIPNFTVSSSPSLPVPSFFLDPSNANPDLQRYLNSRRNRRIVSTRGYRAQQPSTNALIRPLSAIQLNSQSAVNPPANVSSQPIPSVSGSNPSQSSASSQTSQSTASSQSSSSSSSSSSQDEETLNYDPADLEAVPNPEKDRNCSICADSLVDSDEDEGDSQKDSSATPSTDVVKLSKCKHFFHSECIKRWFKQRTVCPECLTNYCNIVGNQPTAGAHMEVVYHPFDPSQGWEVEGFPDTDVIEIIYRIDSGIQGSEHPNPGMPYSGTSRTAYLPKNYDGERVLKLLRQAWDRRLIFCVEASTVAGGKDFVTWDCISHKTSLQGGPDLNGYPDEIYFVVVKGELSDLGIF